MINDQDCGCDWCHTNKCKAYQEWERQEYIKRNQVK